MSKLVRLQTGFRPLEATNAFCVVDEHGHCPACSDEALPARVLSLALDGWTALVLIGGQEREVDVSLVDEVSPGSWLLVHGGVALGRMMEKEA